MGAAVISIDAELAWGFHDQPQLPETRLAGAREAWGILLKLLDRHGIPATWAVVGHLMLEECDGFHADHPAPREWFARDPGGRATDAPRWFAPDLVASVLDADVPHELGSHTFSHLVCGDASTTGPMVDADLARHRELAEEWGYELESLVFPRNKVGHRDRVAVQGFTCYRGRAPAHWYDRLPARRPGKVADLVLGPLDPPVIEPTVDEFGLVNVPASLDLFGFEGFARRVVEEVTEDPIVAAARSGIRAAESGDGVFHGWLHPNNITGPRDVARLDAIFEAIAASDVEAMTMGAVARQHRRAVHA